MSSASRSSVSYLELGRDPAADLYLGPRTRPEEASGVQEEPICLQRCSQGNK